MTQRRDPQLVNAMWRAVDLTRAYLAQDRDKVAACLKGLDTSQMEQIFGWLILDHDQWFEELGEPPVTVRELYSMAALAPMETEAAVAAAVQRVRAGEAGITGAVGNLALLDQVHAIAIETAVMVLEAFGRVGALQRLDTEALRYEQMGYPRPYPIA
ncbi:hypothetical protein ACFCWT_34320 [Streptomyces olivaceus]|uniref:hypothetical protein n=1 Tax=Streptomyces olivaceus TaxID=47716 RepID=UPI0035E32E9F